MLLLCIPRVPATLQTQEGVSLQPMGVATLVRLPTHRVAAAVMAMLKRRSSGAKRLRSSYIGRCFSLDNRQFVVDDVIAEGGFAVVLEVRCTASNERLALKRVAVNNEQDLYLCRQEIAIMKALSDCPHSVTYIDSAINRVGKDVFEVLILMQLYAGQTVMSMLQQEFSSGRRLPERQVMKIFTDVCRAVARLHHRTKPITHRDLKVENVLQDFSNNFVLCDFGSCTTAVMVPLEQGVAECEEQIQRFTTLPYRSPEMIDMYSGNAISTKADVWALGCVLYKLCFFDTPFGERSLAIMKGQVNFPQDSPYSSTVHSLISYTLDTSPEERPDIYQVCTVAFNAMHQPNPVLNVFNSPMPVLSPPKSPRPAVSKAVTKQQTSSCTPQSSPQVTVAMTTSTGRPRPRPSSTIAAPPSSPAPPHRTSGPHQSRQKVDAFGSVPFSGKQTASTNSVDVFGATPFTEYDAFGAQPFNRAAV